MNNNCNLIVFKNERWINYDDLLLDIYFKMIN